MTCPICSNTSGARIVARASAGAALVEAREALARVKRDDLAGLDAARERLRKAESDYKGARMAEQAVTS